MTETTTAPESVHETNGTVTEPAAPRKAEKTTRAAKKAVKAKAAKAVKPDRSAAAVPVKERRLKFLRLLRKLGATSAHSAAPVSKLAKSLGYNPYDVYCLGYHKYPLAVGGFVKQCKPEDSRELAFYLTAKGQKTDPE